ncbi:MAG: homoserine dehydrogenase [Rickettsiales bacterium]
MIGARSRKTLRLGLAGLGTVGAGVVALVERHADLYERRCGARIVIHAVSARQKDKRRPFNSDGMVWVDNPADLANIPDIDVVAEAIGGANGVALDLCKRALRRGKHVVTANKTMVAENGAELAALAEKHGATLAYEAAVAGAVPVVKTLREGLAGNSFTRIYGLLNGTCNYILSEMEKGGVDFDSALKGAQARGYAEADPGYDIDGRDAAHKLAILSALAFGGAPTMEAMAIEGIRRLLPRDFTAAKLLGGTIRLTACAERDARGNVSRAVYPAFVSFDSDAARSAGAENLVCVEGDAIGKISLKGPGAGMLETASAIMGDVMDLARGYRYAPFSPKEFPIGNFMPLSNGAADRVFCVPADAGFREDFTAINTRRFTDGAQEFIAGLASMQEV